MEGVRFLVPFRSDGDVRDRLWDRCHKHWARGCPDIPVRLGASPDGPFNRGAAISDAARGEWDVAVVLDADVIAEPAQVYAAIDRARITGRATLAFERFIGLNAAATKRVLNGGEMRETDARYLSDVHESSIVAVPRALWDEVGGFDERFVGWGQEDVAFIQSCRILGGGIERIEGLVFHLEHGLRHQRGRGSPQYRANQVLGQRYREAKTAADLRELWEGNVSDRAREFRRIWATNGWNGTDTKAGPGSSTEATAWLQASLMEILADLGASSVLDAGCSESLWMPPIVGYVGVDIVEEAVEVARKRHPDRDYRVADICADELPSVDAVICRDTLQHLSLLDGLTALQNLRRTGAKWLLANTHRGGVNRDIRSGGWFEIDLEASPFWLGEPLKLWPDGAWKGQDRYPNKVLGVWEL